MQLDKLKPNIFFRKKKKEKNNIETRDKKDVFLQTPIRNLGFLDEAGEILRPVASLSKNPIIRKLPNFSYIPANLYIAADVANKYKKGDNGKGRNGKKIALREAMYQGVVSILAPMGIVRGTNKIINHTLKQNKDKGMTKHLKETILAFGESKKIPKFLKNKKLNFALMGAGASLFALSTLSKPVDRITDKIFSCTIDPMLGITKDKKAQKK